MYVGKTPSSPQPPLPELPHFVVEICPRYLDIPAELRDGIYMIGNRPRLVLVFPVALNGPDDSVVPDASKHILAVVILKDV